MIFTLAGGFTLGQTDSVNQRTTDKIVLAVALCGEHGGLVDYLVTISQTAIGAPCALKLIEYRYADEIVEAARRQSFDLFIVFLNPTLIDSQARESGGTPRDFEILSHLKSNYRKPLIVVHNGYAGHTDEAIVRAGADAVFGMPFDCHVFMENVRDLLFG